VKRLSGLVLAAACSGPAGLDRAALLDPQTCGQCHPDHFREWSGSMHAYASDDPVFRAMNRKGQADTNGQLKAFCVNCHAPMAVQEQATTDGLNLDSVPAKLKGVTCFFCHTVDAVNGTHDNPLHLATDLTMRGAISDPQATGHRAMYSALHDRDQTQSSSLCGACHDVVTPHGATLERTFAEWQASAFATPGEGSPCGQCHMNQSTALQPIATGGPNRRAHSHTFPAVDLALTDFPEKNAQRQQVQELLDSTLQTALCVADLGGVRVLADNVAAGHGFPSGAAQDRRVWFELHAYSNGQQIYETGAPDAGADPDLWMLRDCIFDAQGTQVEMFWQAASFESNALPGLATFDMSDPRFYETHRVQQFPRNGGFLKPDRVTMTVHLQAIGSDVLAELDAGVMPPLMDLGAPLEWTEAAATAHYLEDGNLVRCVTATHFNVTADKQPATNHARCTP
jgi:hypothetical protein